MRLRGLAVVELEQAAESLTTLDLAWSDRRCLGRDEFVAETLVRPFFMIMMEKFSCGRPEMAFAKSSTYSINAQASSSVYSAVNSPTASSRPEGARP